MKNSLTVPQDIIFLINELGGLEEDFRKHACLEIKAEKLKFTFDKDASIEAYRDEDLMVFYYEKNGIGITQLFEIRHLHYSDVLQDEEYEDVYEMSFSLNYNSLGKRTLIISFNFDQSLNWLVITFEEEGRFVSECIDLVISYLKEKEIELKNCK